MKPGMGDLEAFFFQNPVPVKEKIQIDDPGTPWLLPDSSHPFFDGKEKFHELLGAHRGLYRRDSVDEPLLILLAHRFRAVKTGTPNRAVPGIRTDGLYGPTAISQLVAQVRTNSDIGQQVSKSFAPENTKERYWKIGMMEDWNIGKTNC